MTTIQIDLPEATVQAARAAGLLTPLALDRLLWHGRPHAVLTQVRGSALGVPTFSPAQALQRVCSG